MHIGIHNPMFTYTIANKQLEAVKQERDLRFIIAEDLKPSAHCTESYTKANRMLDWLKLVIMLNLYKSIVTPHLEYCSPAWSPYYKKDKELLEKIQHRFTRFFKDLKDLDYSERLTRLGLWSSEERRNRADLIEVFKIVNGHSALPAETFFKFKVDTRTRGHSRMLLKGTLRRRIAYIFFGPPGKYTVIQKNWSP